MLKSFCRTRLEARAAQPARRATGKGERGIACLPDRVGEFQEGVGRAIDYAKAFGCRQLNCLAGLPEPASSRPGAQDDRRQSGLRGARVEDEGIRLLIEPINTLRHSRLLPESLEATALDVIHAVGRDNLFLQYDIYHMQRMEGELAATIQKHLPSHRAYPARRQPRPQRTGHGRDQLRVSVRPAGARSAMQAGSAASTSRLDDHRRPRLAWRGLASQSNASSADRTADCISTPETTGASAWQDRIYRTRHHGHADGWQPQKGGHKFGLNPRTGARRTRRRATVRTRRRP